MYLQILVSGLLIGSIYSIISIGITLIYGTMRIVNFCYGDFLMLGMYATYGIMTLLNWRGYWAMLPVAIIMFGLGALIFRFLVRPLIGRKSRDMILLTVGLGYTLQNLMLTLFTGDYRKAVNGLESASLRLGSISISVPQLIAFLFAVAIVLALFLFLQKTRTGQAIRAVGQERQAAALMGINVNAIYMITYALGVALAGVAATAISPIYYTHPTCGSGFSILACIVVVMGGLGSFGGAVVSGLIIGIVEVASGYFIAPALNQAVYFLIFIIVIIVRPTGLFGLGAGSEEVGFD